MDIRKPDLSIIHFIPVPSSAAEPLLAGFPLEQKRVMTGKGDNPVAIKRLHIQAIQDALGEGREQAVVLQTDAQPVVAEWQDLLERMFEQVKYLPWGVLYLRGGGISHGAVRVINTEWEALPHGSIYSFAYIVSADTMRTFLARQAPAGKITENGDTLASAILRAVRESGQTAYKPTARLLRQV
jgi:hypothetical protein